MTARPDPGAEPPTPPYGRGRGRGAPTPPYGTPEGPATREEASVGPVRRAPRRAAEPRPADPRAAGPRVARRRVPDPRATATETAQRRLVGVARVLAGGLVVLTLAVVGGPWVLGGPGAGGAVVAGHVVGAALAIAATAVAAHPRTPSTLGVLAALAVPVDLLVVLGTYWWA